jgi:hypothetical protein
MTKISRSAVATVFFLLVLVSIYWVHVHFLRVDVVFYSALADVLLAATLAAVPLLLLRYFAVFNGFEKILLLSVWLLVGYSIAISVPTVIDRSLSFYILEKLQQRGGAIRLIDFEEIFTRDYAREHHLVDVRVTEQLQSGTVVLRGGCVQLTNRGYRLAGFSRFFRKNLLPRKRLLMGQYTDVLTDPFRYSEPHASTDCRAVPADAAAEPARKAER